MSEQVGIILREKETIEALERIRQHLGLKNRAECVRYLIHSYDSTIRKRSEE